jgi:histidinol-phosphate aminotransferase
MTARSAVLDAPYATRGPTRDDVLLLDRNEGPAPSPAVLRALRRITPTDLHRYPDAGAVEALVAERLGVSPERVLVTAGADDVIDRCCRAALVPGRTLVYPAPAFQMLERYALLAGGELKPVAWPTGRFPLEAFLDALDDATGLAAIVSPNNPTGAVVSADEFARVARATGALVLLDHAYVEYADQDLTDAALAFDNVAVARTLSKAWGLAGCRVGYAVASPAVIRRLRAAGAPYPVAAPSLAAAAERLTTGGKEVAAHVARVRRERTELTELLRRYDAGATPSQASFVLARLGARAAFVRDALGALGVLLRDFSSRPDLDGALRVSLPGKENDFARLVEALRVVFEPEALLFDLDGVVADAGESYDACIQQTAAAFGVTVTRWDAHAARAVGDAANDWLVTQRLLAARGVTVPLHAVRARFQQLYLGGDRPGLRERERLLVPPELLRRLAARCRLGIVTGRPRDEAVWFLERHGIAGCFATLVTMDDAPSKPSPEPVRLALKRLGASRAWLVGDTPDDMRAARAAGVLPIGAVPPAADRTTWETVLRGAGAAAVLEAAMRISELLP